MEQTNIPSEKHHKKTTPDHPITLEQAKERGRRWLDVLGELPYFKGKNARFKPKALFIPYDDLIDLLEVHKKHHRDLSGIRIYFGLVPNTTPIEPDPVTYDLRGSIVAVGRDDKDIINATGKLEEGGIGDVYDFTAPCPDVCDTDSELFRP